MRALARMRLKSKRVLGNPNHASLLTSQTNSLDVLFQPNPSNYPSLYALLKTRWVEEVVAFELEAQSGSEYDSETIKHVITHAAQCLCVGDSCCNMIMTRISTNEHGAPVHGIMSHLVQAAEQLLAAKNTSSQTRSDANVVLMYIAMAKFAQSQGQQEHRAAVVHHQRNALIWAQDKNPLLLTLAAAANAAIQNQMKILECLYEARSLFEKLDHTQHWWAPYVGQALIGIHEAIGKTLANDNRHVLADDTNFDQAVQELTEAVRLIYGSDDGECARYRGDGVLCEYLLARLEQGRGHYSAARKWFCAAEEHEKDIGCPQKKESVAQSPHKMLAQFAMQKQMAEGLTSGKKFQEGGNECGFCGKPEEQEGKRHKRCTGCMCVCYCSTDCQRKHWKKGGHKQKCKQLAAAKKKSAVPSAAANDNANSKANSKANNKANSKANNKANNKANMKKAVQEKLKAEQTLKAMTPLDVSLVPETEWARGVSLMENGQYEDAIFLFCICQFMSWNYWCPKRSNVIVQAAEQARKKCARNNVSCPSWLMVVEAHAGRITSGVMLEMERLCDLDDTQRAGTYVEPTTLGEVNKLRWATGFYMLIVHRNKTQFRDKTELLKLTKSSTKTKEYYGDCSQGCMLTHRASGYISGDRWITMAFELAYTSRDSQAFEAGRRWSQKMQAMGEKFVSADNEHWQFFLDRDRVGQSNWDDAEKMLKGGRGRDVKKKGSKKQKQNSLCACGSGRKFKRCCGKKNR